MEPQVATEPESDELVAQLAARLGTSQAAPERKRKSSRKSYVSQEQDALSDAQYAFGKKLDISQLKLISRRLETLAPLAAEERAANKEQGTTDREQQLTAYEQAQTRIAELETENQRLNNQACAHVCPVTVKVVPDPAHSARIAALENREKEQQAQVAFLLKHVAQNEVIALQAVRELPRKLASEVCEGVGWHWVEVASFNQSYKTFAQWNDIVCRASSNGNLAKLCRAAIQLDIGTRTTDPLTAAKIATGTIRTD